jgi:hypothetical protein
VLRLPIAAVLLAAAPALVLAGEASAARAPTLEKNKALWATINVCDSPAHPDTVGIRASMPGSGIRKERMYMRFQVEYFKATDALWHDIGPGGDSGFVAIGSAKYERREAGRNFVLNAPPAGQSFRVRGAVTFEWRRGAKVVRRATKRTRAGHPATVGADPRDFSAAECAVMPPAP